MDFVVGFDVTHRQSGFDAAPLGCDARAETKPQSPTPDGCFVGSGLASLRVQPLCDIIFLFDRPLSPPQSAYHLILPQLPLASGHTSI